MEKIAVVGIPLLAFFGGMAFNAYSIAQNIATKPWVEDGLRASRTYTDERVSSAFREAIEHSDMNRQLMMTEIGKVATKQDMILDTVKVLQADFHSRR